MQVFCLLVSRGILYHYIERNKDLILSKIYIFNQGGNMNQDLYYDLDDTFRGYGEEELKEIKKRIEKEQEFCAKTAGQVNMHMQDILSKLMNYCDVDKYADNMMVLLIRDVLQNTDIISILLEKSAHSSADIALRGIFERMLIITYILKPNEIEYREHRACEYYLINLYERKRYLEILNDKRQLKSINEEIKSINDYKFYGKVQKENEFKLFNESDEYHNINFSKLSSNIKCYKLYMKYYIPMSSCLHGKNILDYHTDNEKNSLLQQLRCPFNGIEFLKKYIEIILKILESLEKWKKEIISEEIIEWKYIINKDMLKIEDMSVKVFQPKDFKKTSKFKNDKNYKSLEIN